MDRSFLLYAKIRIKGTVDGFLSPIVELPCQGVTIHVGMFNIDSPSQMEEVTGRIFGMLRRSLGEEGLKDVPVIKISDTIHIGINGDTTLGGHDTSGEYGRKEVAGAEVRGAEVQKDRGSGCSIQRNAWETRGKEMVVGNEGTLRISDDRPTGSSVEGEGSTYVAMPPKKRYVDTGEVFNAARVSDSPVASMGQSAHLEGKEGTKHRGGPNLSDKRRLESNLRGSWRPKKRADFKRPIIMRREEEPTGNSKIGNPILRIGDRNTVGSGKMQSYPLFYQRAKRDKHAGRREAPMKETDMALALYDGDEGVRSEGNESWNVSIGLDVQSSELSCSESTYVSSGLEDNQSQLFTDLGEVCFLKDTHQSLMTGEMGEFIIPLDCAPPVNSPQEQLQALESAPRGLGSSPEEQGIFSNLSNRQTIFIAGREVEWVRLRKVLRASKIQLVGAGGQQGGYGSSKSVRRKGKDRELKNLEFNVKYTRNVEGAAKVIK